MENTQNYIIVMQGPPAGGKSTLANELYQTDKKNRVIVNRDNIRRARGDYWVPKQEDYISKLEEYAVRAALDENLTPIIDATNLNPKTIEKWEKIAKEYNVKIEYVECVVPYKVALERDKNRENSVGVKVLKNFYYKYYPHLVHADANRNMKPFDNRKPKCIICDIDGTVALHTSRNPFEFDKVDTDEPDFRVCDFINTISSDCDYYLIFLSGREGSEVCRKKTEEWIEKYIKPQYWMNMGIIPEENWRLYMRAEGDKRADEIVKKELYEKHIEPWYNVAMIFDDRDKVVKMWRDLGLPCSQVYYGDF